MGLAVQDTIHGRVAANLQGMQTHVSFSRSENPNANVEVSGVHAYRERPLAVAALEACLVVGDPVGGEEVDEVHRLVAGFALVLRAGERHGCRRLWLWLHALARRWMESQSLLSSALASG